MTDSLQELASVNSHARKASPGQVPQYAGIYVGAAVLMALGILTLMADVVVFGSALGYSQQFPQMMNRPFIYECIGMLILGLALISAASVMFAIRHIAQNSFWLRQR